MRVRPASRDGSAGAQVPKVKETSHLCYFLLPRSGSRIYDTMLTQRPFDSVGYVVPTIPCCVEWGTRRLCVLDRSEPSGLAGGRAHKVKETTHLCMLPCRGEQFTLDAKSGDRLSTFTVTNLRLGFQTNDQSNLQTPQVRPDEHFPPSALPKVWR